MTFGRIISQACKKRGVSHVELSRRLGVSQPRVQQIVSSQSLSEELLRRCAKALNLRVVLQLKDKGEK